MTFGFPAYHTETYRFGEDVSDVRNLAIRALDSLAWPLLTQTDSRLEAKTGVSLLSFGEKITIDFLSDYEISVTSKCSIPTQCFDWGKNRSNVSQLLSQCHWVMAIGPPFGA